MAGVVVASMRSGARFSTANSTSFMRAVWPASAVQSENGSTAPSVAGTRSTTAPAALR